ncbi:MAG: substrate-binding domain-containing protein [Armatimonadetes bacterium]|nr:substrate-binding domain-containing protein [Armatimonadota bacterium]
MHALSRIAAAGAALAALSLTACTNKGAETGPAGGEATPPPAPKVTAKLTEPPVPKEAVPSAPSKKPYKIGVSLLTRDDEFYKTLEQGLNDEARKQNVTVTIESGDKDLNKQINQVQNFVAQKEDAIVLCPVDSQGVTAAVTAANNANIPVFTADIASKGGKVISHIASDNVQGGRLVGDYAAKTVLSGKGNVAILDLSTVTSVQDRVKGFKEALAKYPNIKIIADQDVEGAKRENAVPKATDLLTAHPDLNLIFGINDPVALGALSALQQANKKDIAVVGFDAIPEAQTYIASGNSPLKADAIQYPHVIGVTTIDAIVKSLNGEAVPPVIPVPTGLVTPDSFKK